MSSCRSVRARVATKRYLPGDAECVPKGKGAGKGAAARARTCPKPARVVPVASAVAAAAVAAPAPTLVSKEVGYTVIDLTGDEQVIDLTGAGEATAKPMGVSTCNDPKPHGFVSDVVCNDFVFTAGLTDRAVDMLGLRGLPYLNLKRASREKIEVLEQLFVRNQLFTGPDAYRMYIRVLVHSRLQPCAIEVLKDGLNKTMPYTRVQILTGFYDAVLDLFKEGKLFLGQ